MVLLFMEGRVLFMVLYFRVFGVAAVIALTACERALAINPKDPWIKPTLLGAAFDTGNVADARKLMKEIRKGRPAEWVLKTTLDDLETSKNLHQDPAIKQNLEMVCQELEKKV